MMNEADTKEKLIDPYLRKAGWDEGKLKREYRIKNDRFHVSGEEYTVIEVEDKFADYVLSVNNVVVGVVEAKKESLPADRMSLAKLF